MGCAGSAFVASALAVEKDVWLATAAAMMVFGIAGELAAEDASGPGTLAVAILDSLHEMTADMVVEDAWAEA
jgi:hydroxyethylthiazole kinase